MLYTAFEQQARALWPLRQWARAVAPVLSNGPFGAHPPQRHLAAALEVMRLAEITHRRPPWDIASAGGHDVIEETAASTPFATLTRFAKVGAAPQARVLIVAPMSGHFATLLRDTVRSLLDGHDVWVTDWVDARMVPLAAGPFHLDDYIGYVQDWIRLLGEDLHVVSVCQPTVPVLAAISLLSFNKEIVPRTMVMMGGPIDARRSPTAVNNLATRKPYSWFERTVIHRVPEKYPGYMRRVYPGFLQHLGFVAMNPDRHLDAHWDYFNHLMAGDDESAEKHRDFYDEYNAVLDLPAEYYLDTVRAVFQEFALPKGRMFVRGELVRPQAIRETALLTIEGELDDISGNGQTEAAHALCLNIPRGRREHYVAPNVGHYGIFSGRRWREVVFPRVRDFIATYSS